MKKREKSRVVGMANLHFEFSADSPTQFKATVKVAEPFPDTLPTDLRDAMVMKLMAHALNLQAAEIAEAKGVKDWSIIDQGDEEINTRVH